MRACPHGCTVAKSHWAWLPCWSPTACSGLKALLSRLDLFSLWPLFEAQQVDVRLLASWDLPTLKAYFRHVPGGATIKILCRMQITGAVAVACDLFQRNSLLLQATLASIPAEAVQLI